MRLGILIIGSLIWSPNPVRCRWRQNRLSRTEKREVMVPIRYGRKPKTDISMVFSRSCSEASKLGKGLVVPARVECCEPQHLIEEARHLWAAEANKEQLSGICSKKKWGKVCVLKNPRVNANDPILLGWIRHITEIGSAYSALPVARGEGPVLDPDTGLALFDWPKDVVTNKDLTDFDLLLMTANEPTLDRDGQYLTVDEIASAWRTDTSNVEYFYNNRHCGITTFQDEAILGLLRGSA